MPRSTPPHAWLLLVNAFPQSLFSVQSNKEWDNVAHMLGTWEQYTRTQEQHVTDKKKNVYCSFPQAEIRMKQKKITVYNAQ